MIVAQPSSSTRSPRPFPNSASSQRPLRLRVIRSIAPLSCAKTQKCPPVSPLPATLTHSLSRNPFACHSYANTRDGGVSAFPLPHLHPLPPIHPLSVSTF